MDEKLLALFEKSRIFSMRKFTSDTKISIEEYRGYRFFICNCFERDIDCFITNIKDLLSRYIQSWATILDEDPKKEFNWKEYSQNVFGLFDSFNWDEIYKTVESGKDTFTFDIKVNNSKIQIRRFGDILAFNLLKNGDDEHRTGLKTLNALCRAEDSYNNQGIYELIHKVNVSFPIPNKNTQNSTYLVDFEQIFDQLKGALPKAEWNFDANLLIENYLNNNPEHPLDIGEFLGFKICANLIHTEKGVGNPDGHILKIWRKGNVNHVKNSEYQFEVGYDIEMSLSIKSSLPDKFMSNSDLDSKFHKEQFRLAEVAAIFIAQLCSMQATVHLEARNAINSK